MKPIFVINFKTYKQGKDVLKLAKIIQKVDKEIIVGVQPTDINELKFNTKLKIYSQHVDVFEKGRNTGYVLPEAVKDAGAVGTFLNHSEHKINFKIMKQTIAHCKKIKLRTMVFVASLIEAQKIQKLKPDYIIIEPPELVAGKISVSQAKPELIKKISKKLKTKFLVGAGIHSKKDINTAMKLGASGIALSSAVMKSKNPEKVLRGLLKD